MRGALTSAAIFRSMRPRPFPANRLGRAFPIKHPLIWRKYLTYRRRTFATARQLRTGGLAGWALGRTRLGGLAQMGFVVVAKESTMFCGNCGTALADSAHFCTACGVACGAPASAGTTIPVAASADAATARAAATATGAVAVAAVGMKHASSDPSQTDILAPGDTPAQEVVHLGWENKIRILGNPDVWSGMLLVFGISCALGAILFFVISKSVWAVLGAGAAFLGFMALFIIVGFVIDLFGGFLTRFALTTSGVRSLGGKGARTAAQTAFWVGVLAGKPGAAGAGLLAESEQDNFIAYPEISEVRLRPGRFNIRVKGGFLQKPIALYCLPDNYVRAEALLRQHCPQSKFV